MELLVLMALFGAVLSLQAIIYKKCAFSALDYESSFSKAEATEGDEITLIEVVSNNKALPLPWLKAEIITSKWLELSQLQSTVTDCTRYLTSFFMLLGYQRITRKWRVKCLKRGIFTIERNVLVASDLLKGIMLSRPFDAGSLVMVLPRPISLDELFIPANNPMGDVVIRRNILPDPFYISGVREYTERDPVNHIHWGATAREGRIMVYNNDYTAAQSQTVILNLQAVEFANSGGIYEERIETAIRICAALFEETLDAGMPLRFMTNSSPEICTEEYFGDEHLHGLLQLLAGLTMQSGEHFPFYLNGIYDNVTSTDIAIVTSYLDDAIVEFAKAKSYDGINVKVFVVSVLQEITEDYSFELYHIREEALPLC